MNVFHLLLQCQLGNEIIKKLKLPANKLNGIKKCASKNNIIFPQINRGGSIYLAKVGKPNPQNIHTYSFLRIQPNFYEFKFSKK